MLMEARVSSTSTEVTPRSLCALLKASCHSHINVDRMFRSV
jgi:hypothetical protein